MIRPHQAKRFAEEHGIPVREHLVEWLRAADRRIMELELDARELVEDSEELADEDTAVICSMWAIDLFLEAGKIRRDQRMARDIINPPKHQPAHRITDEQIARAKDYPVTDLVEFDRAGKALAWCHDDKTPSLHHNRNSNRAHCFPCGKSFNAIDIMMSREGLTFIDAVKFLTR